MSFLALKKFLPPSLLGHEDEICGIDEVGRGCWAGPLVACALMIPKRCQIAGARDSKQLLPHQREKIYAVLQQKAVFGIGVTEVKEIDQLGIIRATNLAFLRALENLPQQPAFLVIDGRDKLSLPYQFRTIIRGDQKLKLIACASIVAKVVRDCMMVEAAKEYPNYHFEQHKGYGTDLHRRAIKEFGSVSLHRQSFKPIQLLRQTAIPCD